jgi:hypothetical protein
VYLDEANVSGLLAEALTTDVEAVFADETSLVGADAAMRQICQYMLSLQRRYYHDRSIVRLLPCSGSLAVRPWTGVPDCLVGHADLVH